MADPRTTDQIAEDQTETAPQAEDADQGPYPEVVGQYRSDAIPVPYKQQGSVALKWLGEALKFMIPVRAQTFPDRLIKVNEAHSNALSQIPSGRELMKATTLPSDAEQGRWFTFADDHYATRTREGWRMHAYEKPSDTRSLAMVIRSLRRSEQESRLFDLLEAELAPEHQLHLQRFRDADATASMIQTAWELNREGHRSAWRDLGRMDEVQPMLDAFKAALKDDRRAGRNGKAVRASFDEWFKSQARINARDAVTIADMGQRPNRFAGDEDASEALLASAIARLGWRPGLNYLEMDGAEDLSSRRYFKAAGKENSTRLAQIEEGVMGQIAVRSLTEQRALQRQMNNSLAYAALPLQWPASEPVAAQQPAAVEPDAPVAETKDITPPKAKKPAADRRREPRLSTGADNDAATPVTSSKRVEPTISSPVAAPMSEEELHKASVKAVADELGVDLDELKAEQQDQPDPAAVEAAAVKAVADELGVDLEEGQDGWNITAPTAEDRPAPPRRDSKPFWHGWKEAFIARFGASDPVPKAKRVEPTIGDWSGLKADQPNVSRGPNGETRREPTISKP
ncbi:MAG: hypothetical protein Alpg2KO_32450 [Alphaproteobacteria bacterium]